MSVVASLLLGLGLGLSLAAPPGPMNAIIAREAGRHGPLAGIRVGMGAPVADVVWLVVLWFGLGALIDQPMVVRGMAAFGALLMAYFSFTTLRAREDQPDVTARPTTFVAGFAMAITNPYQAAWWVSGGFVFLKSEGAWGVGGLLVGIFVWVVGFSWLVAHGAQRYDWFRPAIRFGSGLLLAGFAIFLALLAAGVIAV